MPKLNGARSKRSRSRKRQFGETKPNFGLEVRKEWEDFIKTEGPRIKEEDPEFYYHLIGKKLPKKYQDPFRGTKPTPAEIIPVKVKTDEEIKKDQVEETSKDNELLEYQKKRDRERAEQLEKDRKKDNQIVFNVVEPIRKDPNRGMRFVNCSEPINKGRLGHSKAFLYKANKTYKYYD